MPSGYEDSEARRDQGRSENGLRGDRSIRAIEEQLWNLRRDFDHFKEETFVDYKNHTKETVATKLEVAKTQIAFWGGMAGAGFGLLSLILRLFVK